MANTILLPAVDRFLITFNFLIYFTINHYSIFALSCLLKITGTSDSMAQTTTIMTDLNDITSPVVVKTYSSTPALIKPKDGGATPTVRTRQKQSEIPFTIYNSPFQASTRETAKINIITSNRKVLGSTPDRGTWINFLFF